LEVNKRYIFHIHTIK